MFWVDFVATVLLWFREVDDVRVFGLYEADVDNLSGFDLCF